MIKKNIIINRFLIGGLFLLTLIIENISMAFATDFPTTVADTTAARVVAEELLKIFDKTPLIASDKENLYRNAGNALKARYSISSFDARLIATRGPLGVVEHRSFFGYSGGFNTLPNIIPGQYLIMVFHTKFTSSPSEYTEQVTIEKDRSNSGVWRLVEYYNAPLK